MERGQRATITDGEVPENRWRILATVLFGLFSVNVTVTILAVSIHNIADELGTSEPTMTWVVTGPMLAFGVIGPLVGKLGDRLGHRRLFLWGLFGAAVMAAASALAWNAGSLIAFRTLGAIEGAATGPASFAIISRIFPKAERVKALGYWSMVGAGAPVIGVVAGGPLVEAFGWRMIFVGQVPIALLALSFAWRLLPETPRHRHGTFDLAGAALVALSVTPLLFALSEAPRMGWTSPLVLGCVAVTPVALVLFVRVERRASNPLLPLAYLRRRGFTFAILTQALLNGAYMGSFILTPLLLQNVLGYSETRTGLVSIARPLAFSLAGTAAGVVALRIGARRAATGGALAVVAALAWMATLGASSGVLTIMGALALAGIGMGIAMPPLAASVTVSVDDNDFGIAGAAQQMMTQVGVVFGIQLMQVAQQSRIDAVGRDASYHWGYLAGLVIAALAVLTATRIASAPTRAEAGDPTPALEPAPAL
ncbi:MFS transporter [Aquihabitans sp. G128]|uniref:MFS transporter n=1 Tax=Aquihabitans sp. G128 TaxID=2849779 RepID=UPI001C22DCB2|nr:MFS transporter [Aquihabitans sp. G128]QXC63109.1 MFS transporter [Aquihabitans sp. G128]